MNILTTIADCFRMCVSPFQVLEKYKDKPFNWFLVFFFSIFLFFVSSFLPLIGCERYSPFDFLTIAIIILILFFIVLGKLFGGITRYNHIFQAVLLSIFPILVALGIANGIISFENSFRLESLLEFFLILLFLLYRIAIVILFLSLWWILKHYHQIKSIKLFFTTIILIIVVFFWGWFLESTLLYSPGFVNCSPNSIVLPPPVAIP